MRTILGPMRCQGCGLLVTYGETTGTVWVRERREPRRRAMFEPSRRVHLCPEGMAARMVRGRVA